MMKEKFAEEYYKTRVRSGTLPGPSSLCEQSFLAGFAKRGELDIEKVRKQYSGVPITTNVSHALRTLEMGIRKLDE